MNLKKSLLRVRRSSYVHLVDTADELLDTEEVDETSVLAGLALDLTLLVVTLLDGDGNTVLSRPIAVREAALAPGDERTITARLSVPPDGIEDMTVTILEADRRD